MLEQTLYLDKLYMRRIDDIARRYPEQVVLNARNTSGKTLTLFVTVPGLFPKQKIVVRLHRRLHKTFWKIVEQAKRWLEAFKNLFAPKPLALPATIETPVPLTSDQQKLIAAAAKLTVQAEKPLVAAYDWRKRSDSLDKLPDSPRSKWEFYSVNPGGLA